MSEIVSITEDDITSVDVTLDMNCKRVTFADPLCEYTLIPCNKRTKISHFNPGNVITTPRTNWLLILFLLFILIAIVLLIMFPNKITIAAIIVLFLVLLILTIFNIRR